MTQKAFPVFYIYLVGSARQLSTISDLMGRTHSGWLGLHFVFLDDALEKNSCWGKKRTVLLPLEPGETPLPISG